MGALMRDAGERSKSAGLRSWTGPRRSCETGSELIAVLPTLERALEMATPLEGAIDRFGRLVDRLPGGTARRRVSRRPIRPRPPPTPTQRRQRFSLERAEIAREIGELTGAVARRRLRRRSGAWPCSRSSERPTDSAAATRPSFRYQTLNSPSSSEPRTTSWSHSDAGPTYSSEAQSERSEKKYGHDVVRLVAAEHVERGGLAVVERHVPVLDPQPAPAVDHALVLGDVAGREDPGSASLQPGVDAARRRSPPARARRRAPASRRGSPRRRSPPRRPRARARTSVTTRVTRPSAPSKRSSSSLAVDRDRRAPRAGPGRSAPPARRSSRLSATGSSITIVHVLPELGQRRGHLAARCRSRRSGPPACRRRPRGSRRCCRACAGSGSPRARSPARSAAGRWRRSPAAPGRTPPRRRSDSVAVRASRSSFVTEVRVSTSTCCSSYQLGRPEQRVLARLLACAGSPWSSGGRLYGRSGSRPTSRIEPSAPDSRSQRAQLPGGQAAADQQVVDAGGQPSPARLGVAATAPVEARTAA